MNLVETIRDRKEMHIPIWNNEVYSYPIPDTLDEQVVYKLFIYSNNIDNPLDAGLPYYVLDIDARSMEVVSYNRVSISNQSDRLFISCTNTVESVLNNREVLLNLFDKLSDMPLFSNNITDSELLLLEEYRELLLSSIPPKHKFYYLAYGEKFFNWLDTLSNR